MQPVRYGRPRGRLNRLKSGQRPPLNSSDDASRSDAERWLKRLGCTKYVAQGGDWGALIVDMMGVQAPPGLLGVHTNMAATVPPDVDKAAFTGALPPFQPEERQAYDQLAFF